MDTVTATTDTETACAASQGLSSRRYLHPRQLRLVLWRHPARLQVPQLPGLDVGQALQLDRLPVAQSRALLQVLRSQLLAVLLIGLDLSEQLLLVLVVHRDLGRSLQADKGHTV